MRINHLLKKYITIALVFFKWILISILIGMLLGLVGVAFHICVEFVTEFRMNHRYIIALLPFGGLVIFFLYHFLHMENDKGTNIVLESIRTDNKPSIKQAPLIFVSTVITHLFGGSAGREGAALQLGGSIGSWVGRILRLDKNDSHMITMCGMSASFSALFGTPLTAAVFSMEVVSVGVMYYSAIVPCLIAALVGSRVAAFFYISPTAFTILAVPKMTVISIIQAAVLGLLTAVLSTVFCHSLHYTSKLYDKVIPNRALQIFAGGGIVALLSLLIRCQDYNGAGMNIISSAAKGNAFPLAFAIKIVFTALTLGAGYKGGEIVPSLFIGATFGCTAAPLIGLPASFGAAAGMIGLFCGVTNCPISSLIMSIELFGANGMPLYAVTIAVSYMLSGYHGLYSSQRIVYSKFKTKYVNRSIG